MHLAFWQGAHSATCLCAWRIIEKRNQIEGKIDGNRFLVILVVGSFRRELAVGERCRRATPAKVFEIPPTTPLPGRLDALNKRISRTHPEEFEKHGMSNVGYGCPRTARPGKTLIYVISHASPSSQGELGGVHC